MDPNATLLSLLGSTATGTKQCQAADLAEAAVFEAEATKMNVPGDDLLFFEVDL